MRAPYIEAGMSVDEEAVVLCGDKCSEEGKDHA